MASRPLIARLIVCALAAAAPCISRAEQKVAAIYPDSEAARHVGDEATIVGKVVSVSKSAKGTTYLSFGDRFPRQTFSGVVLARDQEKVGDVKAYEGKSVAITGRIEVYLDQKPQIVIRTPEQIKLADPGAVAAPPAPPMPVPAPLPAASTAIPAPPPKPTPPPPAPGARKIALGPNWNTAPQTGDLTRKDLALLFGGRGSVSAATDSETSIVVYPDIPYLTPLSLARKRLNLDATLPARAKITTPGFPSASFTANTFSGIFAGGFTSLSLVTDEADQVVSVLMVDDNPRQRTPDVAGTGGYHTYNFIHLREKATSELVIRHEIAASGSPAGVLVVDSFLIDPRAPEFASPNQRSSSSKSTTRLPRTGKVLERSRWFVPVPIVDLILRSVGNR